MQNRYEEILFQEDKTNFLRTGQCPHNSVFRKVATIGKIKIESCSVCAKEFKRWFV